MKKAAMATPNQRLVEERLRRHWSQQEVADRIGTTAINVSRWECGTTSPGKHFRHQLCDLFGKSTQELGLLPQEEASISSTSCLSTESREQSFPQVVPEMPSPLWNVPYQRNPFFTGREEILRHLSETLCRESIAALTESYTLSGLAGIGKTQTAIEYAYRSVQAYAAIFWMRAETSDTFGSSLVSIADLLNLPEKQEQDQSRVVSAVRRWLSTHTNWLLVLDNVEDLCIVHALLSSAHCGHLLLTTRAQSTGLLARRIELEKLSPEEGALFLLRRAKLIAHNVSLEDLSEVLCREARDISDMMDGLPLALDQAGAYIEETGCSLSDYRHCYQRHRSMLLDWRGSTNPDHPDSVYATFSLSFDRVKRLNPAAADLLRLCAFLHPDAIPEEIFTEGACELGSELEAVATDPFQLDTAIAALRKYSLVRRHADRKTLSIHRLVQAVHKDCMDQELQRLWAERTVRAVSRIFPDATQVGMWPRCQRSLAQAYVCAALIEEWQMASLEAAQLLYRTGDFLRESARYGESELFFRKALDIRVQVLGEAHIDVARCFNNLMLVSYYQGQYAQAELLGQQALLLSEQGIGSENLHVAEILNNLMLLYRDQGDYTQAEALGERALMISEKILGSEHADVARCLNNLAMLYRVQKKYTLAESFYKRTLAISERTLGSEHPNFALTLSNLALLYYLSRKVYASGTTV